MSKDWTPEELQAASQMMKAAGHMSYEEFCETMDTGYFSIVIPSAGREVTVNPEKS